MGFWAKVETERIYQGLSRKELAFQANISYAGIGLGLERNSMPGADTALRISKVLNVSIEFLLADTQIEPSDNFIETEIKTFSKYKKLINDIESLPTDLREPICDMVHRIAKSTISTKNVDL